MSGVLHTYSSCSHDVQEQRCVLLLPRSYFSGLFYSYSSRPVCSYACIIVPVYVLFLFEFLSISLAHADPVPSYSCQSVCSYSCRLSQSFFIPEGQSGLVLFLWTGPLFLYFFISAGWTDPFLFLLAKPVPLSLQACLALSYFCGPSQSLFISAGWSGPFFFLMAEPVPLFLQAGLAPSDSYGLGHALFIPLIPSGRSGPVLFLWPSRILFIPADWSGPIFFS